MKELEKEVEANQSFVAETLNKWEELKDKLTK
jgi:hypothetical protein